MHTVSLDSVGKLLVTLFLVSRPKTMNVPSLGLFKYCLEWLIIHYRVLIPLGISKLRKLLKAISTVFHRVSKL